MNNKPYIQLLKTPFGKYFYDVNKNSIINISNEVYEFLKADDDVTPSDTVAEQIEFLKRKGLLSNNRVKQVKNPLTDNIEEYINNKCDRIVLQITQNCNFRCSYCPYTTSEFYTTRTHSSKRMSEEVAIKAIDFLADHSLKRDSVTIGFYGGEPLLEYDLLKKLVEYANDVFLGKRVNYTITTNGSLLTDEIVSFLEENDFNLLISIDGTKKAHDRNRKFAATGKGTFDSIEKNLKECYKNHKEYFKKKVSINSVMDPRYPGKDYFDLENSDEIYRIVNLRRTVVADENNVDKHAYDEQFVIDSSISSFKALMSLIKRYPKEKINKSIVDSKLVEKEMADRYIQPREKLEEVDSPSGPCIPGTKLFIDVNGVIHICEKASETSKAFILGNIYDGFDYHNIKKLLNIGALTAEKCKNCFAFTLCSVCQKDCNIDDELSAEIKSVTCKKSQRDALGMLYTKLFYDELNEILDREVIL
jgi:uncharacterized protein